MSPRSLYLCILCLTVPTIAFGSLQNERKLAESVALIVKNLMPPGTTQINVYYSMDEMIDGMNSETLNRILPSLQTLAPVSLARKHVSIQFAFVFTDSIIYLYETLDEIILIRNEIRGSLLIYFSMPLDYDFITAIFSLFVASQIIDFHFIVDVSNGLNLLTNFPYAPDNCYGDTPVLVCVNRGEEFRAVNGSKCTVSMKKLSNFNGCMMSVKVLLAPPLLFVRSDILIGLESDILKIISKKLNFTVLFRNYTPTDILSFREFQDKEADISLGRLRTTSFQQANVTSSFIYCHSKLLLVIHSGRSLLSLERILIPASPTIWLIMLIFTASTFCIFRALSFASPSVRDLVLGADNRYPAYWSWVIIFGGPAELRPRTFSARLIFIHWILFHFLMRSSYQSFVYTSIRLDWKLTTPNTLMGVLKNGYQLTASTDTYRSLVHVRYLPHIIRVYDHSDLEALQQLEQEGENKVAILVPEEVYRYYLGTIWGSNLTVAGKAILEQMISMHFMDSFLKDPFDLVIQRLQVSGLLTHWLEAYLRPKHSSRQDTNSLQVLKWADVKGHFQIYAVLLAVSCTTLLLELFSLRLSVLRRIFFS